MNKDYICPKLEKLAILFYGKDCKPYAKEKKKMFIFGSKKYKIKNVISKQVAIYLVIGNQNQFKSK